MVNPPDPGIPAILLAAAARLSYRVTMRDPIGAELGMLVDGTTERPLYATSGGKIGLVQWSIDGGRQLAPHLLSKATADVLCGGTADSEGTVTFRGQRYAIRQIWNGAQMVAEAYSV